MKVFDVCVVGSGPAGGILSKELAEAGAQVVLVEAGRMMTPSDFHPHAWPYELPHRGLKEGLLPSAAYPKEITKAIRYQDCDDVFVDRIRAVGGRSIHWNGTCLRFAARDFRERSLEGVEEDWPLSYEELAPHYSYVERMIGVSGSRENLDIIPDGEFIPALNLRCSEHIVKKTCSRMGIPMIPARRALLTQPFDGRPPCHYCGHCMDGCDVGAIFTVPNSMLPRAVKTGNFTIVQNKLAREIRVNREAQVEAVSVIDTVSRQEEEIRARLFAVCCGTIESARLLLNSRSSQFPNGLANSSDAVGRFLTGHVNASVFAYLEELVDTPSTNHDGAYDHSYIPRFNMNRKNRGYAGGYHYQPQVYGFMYPYQAKQLDGFGAAFKKQVRVLQPGMMTLDGYGKVLARPDNRVTVDPNRPDAYGIPIPVIHFRFGENDRALWKEMGDKAEEILHAAKSRFMFRPSSGLNGFASHETGTVRMGQDRRSSVLNSFCQAHDVKNLFVVDGSCFTTFPEKNPTHTIMALAVRTARYMSSEMKKKNL